MVEPAAGLRTSFHHPGANAMWDGAGLDFTDGKARIFHLGSLAARRPQRAAGQVWRQGRRLLHAAQQAGLTTSVDAVNESGRREPPIILPALKFADYCILDEIEAALRHRLQDSPAGRRHQRRFPASAGALMQAGVRELVILHLPEGGFIRARKGGERLAILPETARQTYHRRGRVGPCLCRRRAAGAARRLGLAAMFIDSRLRRRRGGAGAGWFRRGEIAAGRPEARPQTRPPPAPGRVKACCEIKNRLMITARLRLGGGIVSGGLERRPIWPCGARATRQRSPWRKREPVRT